MQEQVEEKTVAISIKSGKLTGRLLAKAMAAVLHKMQKSHASPKAGRQSIRRMNRTIGGNTDHLEVMGRLKDFERCAKKNGVSYKVVRSNATDPPVWTVYFKAKQQDNIAAAFQEYSAKVLHRKAEKPSILASLRRFKELAKAQPDRVKNKERGGHEL